ncbi:hypothetical protein T265_02276 [Opisthorchis viverrini]|uniref:Uncharacterized protein n=1 Tax=Opisthorchis viverrini TaxID=6198 RepID=A0A074ZZR6_OPIVI|nr:hypothetical protein T265_02276 [Opisthorchis viverrini]KER31507.1 hypothetical protein T265_02276 [Opisthorchis viverrini]
MCLLLTLKEISLPFSLHCDMLRGQVRLRQIFGNGLSTRPSFLPLGRSAHASRYAARLPALLRPIRLASTRLAKNSGGTKASSDWSRI